jgi:hypothetical protein
MPSVLPAGLFLGQKRIGEVRSAVKTDIGWIGLAMVLLTGLEAGVTLSLSAGGAADVGVELPKKS